MAGAVKEGRVGEGVEHRQRGKRPAIHKCVIRGGGGEGRGGIGGAEEVKENTLTPPASGHGAPLPAVIGLPAVAFLSVFPLPAYRRRKKRKEGEREGEGGRGLKGHWSGK